MQTFLRAAGDLGGGRGGAPPGIKYTLSENVPQSIIGSYRKSLFHNKVGRFSHVLGTLQFWLVCYLFTLPVIDHY